jgi:predicted transcriptional regulator
MVTAAKPLFALTAADLMSQPLVLIPQEMSLAGAAHLLTQAQVSGAPVVDGEGRCIGVISATDFVHLAEQGRGSVCGCADIYQSWTIVESEEENAETVQNFMCADPVLIAPNTNLGDLARMMLEAHIHRLIVARDDGRPIGVVTSTDILAAVAQAYQLQMTASETPDVHLPEPVNCSQIGYE